MRYACDDNVITGSTFRHGIYSCQHLSTINSHEATDMELTYNCVNVISLS
jgi:hypothetical protein